MRILSLALRLYHDQYNKYPDNFNCPTWDGNGNVAGHPLCGTPVAGAPAFPACDAALPEAPQGGEDTFLAPDAWNASMQQLVDAGFLKKIINSPRRSGILLLQSWSRHHRCIASHRTFIETRFHYGRAAERAALYGKLILHQSSKRSRVLFSAPQLIIKSRKAIGVRRAQRRSPPARRCQPAAINAALPE
jgi:hypothetical protein